MLAETLQMPGEHSRRPVAVAGQCGHSRPQPWPQRDKESKSRSSELTLRVDEASGFRHFESQLVRNYFGCAELDSMGTGRGGDRGGFHIHGLCAVGLRQVGFLICV